MKLNTFFLHRNLSEPSEGQPVIYFTGLSYTCAVKMESLLREGSLPGTTYPRRAAPWGLNAPHLAVCDKEFYLLLHIARGGTENNIWYALKRWTIIVLTEMFVVMHCIWSARWRNVRILIIEINLLFRIWKWDWILV